MSRALGLDIGNRRIGVATSDGLKMIARPLTVIDRKAEAAVTRIVQIVAEQQADEIVVGMPFNADGSAGEQARRVEQFVTQLRGFLDERVSIRFCDERYSTVAARDIIAGKSRKTQKQVQHDDAISAAVILQRDLDKRRNEDFDSLGD